MTQIQAIEMAERTLAKTPMPGVFAIPFANQLDYDRVDDALTDMGCLTGEYVSLANPAPFHGSCRSVERLVQECGPEFKLFVLRVALPGHSDTTLRDRRLLERS